MCIMDIVVGSRLGNKSSNPERDWILHSANTFILALDMFQEKCFQVIGPVKEKPYKMLQADVFLIHF